MDDEGGLDFADDLWADGAYYLVKRDEIRGGFMWV